ncbi:hypothetical protein CBOM_06051 [Ceraceosorus bombacis]|uniref:Uncharacterized protein n=1 Tax=Ceraceosorus bombacis TaxID=401625 RepID=A0A0P1BIU2_9BASI|nr:hypothetical protein CBOM_06051 [Ceraceosorus bombacis]
MLCLKPLFILFAFNVALACCLPAQAAPLDSLAARAPERAADELSKLLEIATDGKLVPFKLYYQGQIDVGTQFHDLWNSINNITLWMDEKPGFKVLGARALQVLGHAHIQNYHFFATDLIKDEVYIKVRAALHDLGLFQEVSKLLSVWQAVVGELIPSVPTEDPASKDWVSKLNGIVADLQTVVDKYDPTKTLPPLVSGGTW